GPVDRLRGRPVRRAGLADVRGRASEGRAGHRLGGHPVAPKDPRRPDAGAAGEARAARAGTPSRTRTTRWIRGRIIPRRVAVTPSGNPPRLLCWGPAAQLGLSSRMGW